MWKDKDYKDYFSKYPEYEIISIDYKEKTIIYKHLTCGGTITKTLSLVKHNIGCPEKKCINVRRNKTFQDKFGGNPFQNDAVKEKIKQTNLDKYGVDNPAKNKEVYAKVKKTNLEKYGCEFGLQSEEIKDKSKKTCLEKYGVTNPSMNNVIKNKIKKTNLEKYGVTCSLHSKESIKKKTKTFQEHWGSDCYLGSDAQIVRRTQTILNKTYTEKILNLMQVIPLFESKDYKGVNIKHLWKCKKCSTEFEDNLRAGSLPRCPSCYPILSGTSYIEKELQQWVNTHIDIEANKRFFYDKHRFYELDLFIPSKNIGIEMNGLYYHSEISGKKDKNYHLDKTNYFKSLGIQVIHIWDSEWIDKQDIIKSIILSKIGLLQDKIFARKCNIQIVNTIEKNKFLELNHLQGSVNSSINIGLYFESKLVQILTFGKTRYNKNYDYELLRFATLTNTSVIGGFSKLLKYFRNNYDGTLLSYADKRFSIGNIYIKNGFELLNESKPNYFYTQKYKGLESRVKYQKHKLCKVIDIFDKELTEWENLQVNGFDRVWDCGNMVFVS